MNDEVVMALLVMARWMLHNAYEAWTEQGWEQMPDIGEFDYERVVEYAEQMLPKDVTLVEFEEAFKVLEARVTKEDQRE